MQAHLKEPAAPLEKQHDSDRVNILIVDDVPEKLMVYETVLGDLNQNIMTVRSGEEALKLVLKYEFAVILLDVNMPGMDGFETANMIRQRKKSAHTPIIFLTAFNDEVNIAQGYASGAVDYLPTPVVPEVLKAKVRVFIELSQMRQQAALQAEERAQRTAAEEADKRKDEFLGMLAHELRNPLGPIRNAIHLLQVFEPDVDERCCQLRDIINRQVTHMARLIDDLLDATRLARGQILLRKAPCDLTKIVRQTSEDYQSTFEASGVHIEMQMGDRPIWVEGDSTRLVQIIGNLLHNAHKFTNPGGLVTVSLADNGRMATIKVSDDGIGIEPEVLPHIFEVFRQAEQGLDRTKGGLGLGLALVKGLVHLHGGSVSVTSGGAGNGATFSINIPMRQAQHPGLPAREANAESRAEPIRILIVEDNRDAAESTRMLLDMDGHEVHIAYNGHDGIEAARKIQPQVILCDIGLPGMDGYEVARQIRQDSSFAAPYIVALTGYGRDEDQRQARDAGFDLHMTKPIDYSLLRRVLSHLPKHSEI
jgi:signal transduction histidine kinase